MAGAEHHGCRERRHSMATYCRRPGAVPSRRCHRSIRPSGKGRDGLMITVSLVGNEYASVESTS